MVAPRFRIVESLVVAVELTCVDVDHLTGSCLPEVVAIPDTIGVFLACEDPREEEKVSGVLWCVSNRLAWCELSLRILIELVELFLETEAFIAVLHRLVSYLHIFFRRVNDIILGKVAEVESRLDLSVKGKMPGLPLLGGDQDNSVSCTSPVESRSRSVLEYRKVFYVSHIEATE